VEELHLAEKEDTFRYGFLLLYIICIVITLEVFPNLRNAFGQRCAAEKLTYFDHLSFNILMC
jgi:hypothetical protein